MASEILWKSNIAKRPILQWNDENTDYSVSNHNFDLCALQTKQYEFKTIIASPGIRPGYSSYFELEIGEMNQCIMIGVTSMTKNSDKWFVEEAEGLGIYLKDLQIRQMGDKSGKSVKIGKVDHTVTTLGVFVDRDEGSLGFINLDTGLADYAFVRHDLIRNSETLNFAVSILDHMPNKVSFILKALVWQERSAFLFATKQGVLSAVPPTLQEEIAKYLGTKAIPYEDLEDENLSDERQYIDLGDTGSDKEESYDEPGDDAFDYDEDLPEEEED